MTKRDRKRRIAYVLTQGHSGSTIVDMLIGNHSSVVGLGELRFRGDRLITNGQCSCGAETLEECERWSRVNGMLRRDGHELGKLSLLGNGKCVGNRLLFDAVTEGTGTDMVVESTKTVQRLRTLAQCPDFDITVIVLLREPGAVVGSNVRRGRPFIKSTFSHLINTASKLDLANGMRKIVTTYEELVTNTENELCRVMNGLGLEFQKEQIHLSDFSYHMVGGNPIRFNRTHDLVLDERWRTELSILKRVFVWIVVNRISIGFVKTVINVKRSAMGASQANGSAAVPH